jgi:hypothetical protein
MFLCAIVTFLWLILDVLTGQIMKNMIAAAFQCAILLDTVPRIGSYSRAASAQLSGKITESAIYIALDGAYHGFWVAACMQDVCGYFGDCLH